MLRLRQGSYRLRLAAVRAGRWGRSGQSLDPVLSQAEALDLILILHEGDALAPGRTTIGSANDRYGSAEVDYVLQRLCDYPGVVVFSVGRACALPESLREVTDVVLDLGPAKPRRRWGGPHRSSSFSLGY